MSDSATTPSTTPGRGRTPSDEWLHYLLNIIGTTSRACLYRPPWNSSEGTAVASWSRAERTSFSNACVAVSVDCAKVELVVAYRHHPHVLGVVVVVLVEELAADALPVGAWLVGDTPTTVPDVDSAVGIVALPIVDGEGVLEMMGVMFHSRDEPVLVEERRPIRS